MWHNIGPRFSRNVWSWHQENFSFDHPASRQHPHLQQHNHLEAPDVSGVMLEELHKWPSVCLVASKRPLQHTQCQSPLNQDPVPGSTPRAVRDSAKPSFDLSMEQVHSCPLKSHTQAPSTYQDSSACLWQLQIKPPKYFLLCWYSRWILPPVTFHGIRQHSQAKMLST